ncbi:putative serine dehydratase domain-containing protein [Dendryphion nanum]|uniref:D-serine dehydratase n=1 Tax=Dendryphion nanum TaxID=256645 RepID=A0A9P9IZL3_9PLEO|nr:putative serine dehydratase domain-containing protein [Dendryphion nanum]
MSLPLHTSLYPLTPSSSSTPHPFIGQPLSSLPTPAAIIDRAVVKRNCKAMLEACKGLGVGFRAHVKSHKTIEISRLQVGDINDIAQEEEGKEAGKEGEKSKDFIVSTLIEAEHLVAFYKDRKTPFSILYGVPIPQGHIPRLLHLASPLPPYTLSILIDNETAYSHFRTTLSSTPNAPEIGVFIKIDSGYHRAGIETTSPRFPSLVQTVTETSGEGFRGFYSHYGHSYAGSSPSDAAQGLLEELQSMREALRAVPPGSKRRGKLTLSVGATPTATAAQNLLSASSSLSDPKVVEFKTLLQELKKDNLVELHAGVYPLLDLQQLATQARPETGGARDGFAPLAKESIALKVLLEVSSVYTERERPEALVSAGSLALGREPCKSYPGWGIVTGDFRGSGGKVYDERGDREGWIVGRVSQEHGVLTWEGRREECVELGVGERVSVWVNHACVAGAGFGWYAVVDSEGGEEAKVVDVWVRWRGW